MKMRTACAVALLSAISASAYAQTVEERKSPLADAPAVRRRAELRDKRFELGAGVGSTVGQDFYHAILVGPKLAFHLTDWLAIGATAQFNLTKDFKTAFADQLDSTLDNAASGRTPAKAEAFGGMNKISAVYGVHAELVPFTGKLALFSRLFANYDFYGFGGVGFIDFTADKAACTAPKAGESCPYVGMKAGANFGIGLRAFFNDMFALNIEARDILLRNNPAGRDTNGDMITNDDDLSWDSNYIVSVNLMFFLPTHPKLSD